MWRFPEVCKREWKRQAQFLPGSVFAIEPPLNVELEITETEPGFKGDTATGATKLTITESKGESNSYKYKVAEAATPVTYGQNVKNWTAWDGASDITAETGKVITVVECDAEYAAVKAGSATVTAKA
mgnify:CR=1 FL=1